MGPNTQVVSFEQSESQLPAVANGEPARQRPVRLVPRWMRTAVAPRGRPACSSSMRSSGQPPIVVQSRWPSNPGRRQTGSVQPRTRPATTWLSAARPSQDRAPSPVAERRPWAASRRHPAESSTIRVRHGRSTPDRGRRPAAAVRVRSPYRQLPASSLSFASRHARTLPDIVGSACVRYPQGPGIKIN